jgi:carnitine-CoA ligase
MSTAVHERRCAVGDLLSDWAAARPGQLCCALGDQRFTFAEMNARADQLAAGFAALGIGKGDRAATIAPNRVEVLELFYGLARAGVVQIPLNPFLKGSFLAHQLGQSRARILVTDAAGRAAVQPLLDQLPDLEAIVLLDAPAGDRDPRGRPEHPYQVVSEAPGPPPPLHIAPEDTMSIVYTSGTTGLPKGCVLSHGYYTRCGQLNGDALELTSGDVIYSGLPLFHGGGRLIVLMPGLCRGLPVHVDPSFSASRFFHRAAQTGATVAVGVGAMGAALLAAPPGPSDRDHHLRTMMVAPMAPAAQAAFRDRFGVEPWTEVYGQTECMPITVTPISAPAHDRAGCGLAAPDLEIALLDDDGKRVTDGAVGEICLRPRESRFSMFDGYVDQPMETPHSPRGLWYHTGDYGRRLSSGMFAFVDRKKDALRRRGENVSSIELEAAINTHPDILESAVHAVASEFADDDIKACLVLREGAEIDPRALFSYLVSNLPYYAVPRYIELLDELPRNTAGRVMKHVLRERHPQGMVWDFEALGFVVARADRR